MGVTRKSSTRRTPQPCTRTLPETPTHGVGTNPNDVLGTGTTINSQDMMPKRGSIAFDPLHYQVWANEKFIDEPAPGTTNTGGYQAAVAAGTLTSDVVINVMIQERRHPRNGVNPGAFVPPSSLDMDGDYATGALGTAFTAGNAPGAGYVGSDTDGGGQPGTVTLACKNSGKYDGGNVGNAADRMRDAFPDCFFGDEIHGQWTWNSANVLQDVDAASNTAVWKFWAMLQ